MAQDRYDRQIRLWGEEGQEALNYASVHIVGSDGLAFEILKSLVLAGINEFTIIDNATVIQRDVDTNFFIYPTDIGLNRAEVLKNKLLQLSPSVKGFVVDEAPSEVFSNGNDTLWNASIIIVSNCGEIALIETSLRLFDDVEKKIFLARTLGFIDRYPIDLHLTKPWKELKEYVDSIDLENLSYKEHSHVPYSIILMKAYENYILNNNPNTTSFLGTFKEKKEFEKCVLSLRKFNDKGQEGENFGEALTNITRFLKNHSFPEGLLRLFSDPRSENAIMSAREPIWTYIAAIKIFYRNNNRLPLHGSLPDMLSDTTSYTTLLNIYKAKADKDAEEVETIRHEFLKSANITNINCDLEMCKKICKNIAYMDIQNGSRFVESLDKDFRSIFSKFIICNEEDTSFDNNINSNATWLFLFKIYDLLVDEDPSILNLSDSEFEIRLKNSMLYYFNEILKASVNNEKEIMQKCSFEHFSKILPLDTVTEFVRCRSTQIVPINSIVGGITAQEIIKVITKQYIPIDNCLIFDGYKQLSETFKL